MPIGDVVSPAHSGVTMKKIIALSLILGISYGIFAATAKDAAVTGVAKAATTRAQQIEEMSK